MYMCTVFALTNIISIALFTIALELCLPLDNAPVTSTIFDFLHNM